MGNSTQHRKLGLVAQTKFLAHPREKVGKTEMTTTDTLGDAGTSARKGQSADAIRSKNDVGVDVCELDLVGQHVHRVEIRSASEEGSVGQNL